MIPERARVVVVGGGIAGCSLLYHLGRLSWTDAVLLEKGQSAGGYGHCVGRAIALAYLPRALIEAGGRFEIDLLGERVAAVAGDPPL